MTYIKRFSTIRLLEKVNRQPEYAKRIGLIIEMKDTKDYNSNNKLFKQREKNKKFKEKIT